MRVIKLFTQLVVYARTGMSRLGLCQRESHFREVNAHVKGLDGGRIFIWDEKSILKNEKSEDESYVKPVLHRIPGRPFSTIAPFSTPKEALQRCSH